MSTSSILDRMPRDVANLIESQLHDKLELHVYQDPASIRSPWHTDLPLTVTCTFGAINITLPTTTMIYNSRNIPGLNMDGDEYTFKLQCFSPKLEAIKIISTKDRFIIDGYMTCTIDIDTDQKREKVREFKTRVKYFFDNVRIYP